MSSSPLPPTSAFAQTRWTIVLAAGHWRQGTAARAAMGDLAGLYWFPLYAYLRRRGSTPPEAEDLVQGFFARLLEKDALAAADPSRGKFRSFLLASLNHYIANEWDRAHTLKRGGSLLHLDAQNAESRYAADPIDDLTPERVFDRRWALAVLEQVLSRLREEYLQRRQEPLFAALEQVLVAGQKMPYARIAQDLSMTEGAIKVAAHRLRQRYRELLREEIAQTVADPALVEEEIRHLLQSL